MQNDGSIATTTNIAYETTKQGGQDHLKTSSVSTSANVAYGMINLEELDDHVYDVIDGSGGVNPSLIGGTNKTPPSHRLLPAIPPIIAPPTGGNVGVASEREQEIVYATIPGDQ